LKKWGADMQINFLSKFNCIFQSGKVIPRLMDTVATNLDSVGIDPSNWDSNDVCMFLVRNDCEAYTSLFRQQVTFWSIIN
jgi:hypothetical protein